MTDSNEDQNVSQAPPSPLALTRTRRANAGAKMNQLITDEDKGGDEFYATTYGGFVEEENDEDYDAKSDSNDEVDSDFDVELSEDNGEEGEPTGAGSANTDEASMIRKKARKNEIEDDEEEAERIRRRKALKRKRLSTPKFGGPASQQVSETKKSRKSISVEQKQDNNAAEDASCTTQGADRPLKRSALRTSTQFKSEMAEARRKVEHARMSAVRKARNRSLQTRAQNKRRLTQAELLEEAKITEQLNTESLERFREFEELKKAAQRVVKQRKIQTYLSIQFSSITDRQNDGTKVSRNFVSFGDSKKFNEIFENRLKKPLLVSRKICPLTGQPAKYFDPVTKLPYANLEAFKLLRQIHADALKKDYKH